MHARSVLGLLAAAAAGLALGWAAWGEGRAPILALALPLFVAACGSRGRAFAIAAGYALGLSRHAPAFIGGWFDGSLVVGFAVVAAMALISGAAWCVGWSRTAAPWRRAASMMLAWLLALAPPAALGLPGHPLIAMGYLLPGSAWLGVCAALLLAGASAAVTRPLAGGAAAWIGRGGAALVIAGLAIAGALHPHTGGALAARGVHGMNTAWGELETPDAALTRIESMGRQVPPADTQVAVWPESILGRYEPALYPVLELELLAGAKRTNLTHLIGMDLPLQNERLLNGVVAFYPDGNTATAVARQPAPVSLWRPWRSSHTFLADWTASNMLPLGQGDTAAVLFCYEEYMPILYLLNELRDRPTLYLVLANTWAAQEREAAVIQTMHSKGMASLFGRPYVKAENRPAADGRYGRTASVAR